MAMSNTLEILKDPTDVIYMTNQKQIPPEIKRLLKQKKLSFALIPIESFFQIRDRLELISTAIIDTIDLDFSQQEKLAKIIECFETKNIGTILLGNRVKMPVKSFSCTTPAKSFSMGLLYLPDLFQQIAHWRSPVGLEQGLYLFHEGSLVRIENLDAFGPRHLEGLLGLVLPELSLING